jgi:hypothetical protein
MIHKQNLRLVVAGDGLGGPITDIDARSVFPDVRGLDAERGLTDYRCLYFTNLDSDPDGVIDPHIWIELIEDADIAIGLDPAGKNAESGRIERVTDAPAGVNFSTPTSVADPLYLPDGPYLEGEYVAIWVRRTTEAGAAPGGRLFVLRTRGESY